MTTAIEATQSGPNESYSTRSLYQRIKSRHFDYESRRDLYDDQRDVIVELLRPDLVSGRVGQKEAGDFSGSQIVEGSGPHALRIWQRGFQVNMISRKVDWFREQVKDPPGWTGVKFKGNDQVNQWCQDVADHISGRYRRSNYYDVMSQFLLDGGSVGSPVMLFEQDVAGDRMVCKVPDYAAVWLDKDIFGTDNAMHVLWEWTALEAESFFGYDQLPEAIKQQLRNGQHYAKGKYIQAIYGAGDRIYTDLPGGSVATRPWMEHFICLEAQGEGEEVLLRPLNKGPGYFTRPFSSWHYHRNWHEVYGRTMAWWAIYDIRGGNAMWEALFGDAELSVRPATWAMDTLRGMLDMGPGGDNWARNEQEYSQPPTYIERKTRYDLATDFADRLTASSRRHFHYDFFMAINQIMTMKKQPETAYGLSRVQMENGVQLVEQVEAYEQQVLGHGHDIFLEAELAAAPAYSGGRLPQPPDILLEYGDGNVDVEFIGPLSMMQINNRQIERFYRSMEPADFVFERQPETLHKLKWSQVLEHLLESQNFRQDDIVSEDDYQEIVAAARQRHMQQELAEALPKVSQAAKNLQGATEKGSPLAQLTGSA